MSSRMIDPLTDKPVGVRILLVLMVALLSAACSTATTSESPVTEQVDDLTVASGDLYDVSDLVDRVSAGVVSVTQEQVRLDLAGNPQEVPAGAGTGVVVDSEGLVLTNAHVIEGASSVVVVAEDGRVRPAEVVATSTARDLALLAVDDPRGLEALEFGSTEDLEVGMPAVAIGNALGLDVDDPTVSAGIISAKNRSLRTESVLLEGLLQTDAAINPGNSGGPLLDGSGRVVGVNTAIAGGGAQNVGFAIPAEAALRFIEQYRTGTGEPFLGVSVVSNTAVIASQLGVDVQTGAVVVEVSPDSPAAEAGLSRGDVIVGLNETDIEASTDLTNAVVTSTPGESVVLTIVDGSGERTVDVELGERPLSG